MNKKEEVHRYVLRVEKKDYGHEPELVPYEKSTGDHFEVYRSSEDKMWYWSLHLGNSPQGPAAISWKGYRARQTAEGTIKTAYRAMHGAAVK